MAIAACAVVSRTAANQPGGSTHPGALSIGSQRRIQALMRLGHPFNPNGLTEADVHQLYNQLSHVWGDCEHTKQEAIRNDWALPAQWDDDDLDDPDAEPWWEHCPHGHPWTHNNTYIYTNRGRVERRCIECRRGRDATRRRTQPGRRYRDRIRGKCPQGHKYLARTDTGIKLCGVCTPAALRIGRVRPQMTKAQSSDLRERILRIKLRDPMLPSSAIAVELGVTTDVVNGHLRRARQAA